MASTLLYLRHLQRQIEFTCLLATTNKLICDNQGLLIKIAKAVEWTYTTPNVTLWAKWDIELIILTIYKEL